MNKSEIANQARFDIIRYAQLWEDADVLTQAFGDQKGATLVSICSAGDNALAMLMLDPKKVVAIDLSAAQICCLKLRIAAYQWLDHGAFLELVGSVPSTRRGEIFDKLMPKLDAEDREFWQARRSEVIAYGFGGVGKFESFFRIFHSKILPVVQNRANIESVLQPKTREERAQFLNERWNHWRWRLMLKLFFSNFVMGRLGRDPAFFAHVEGQLSDHVAGQLEHAMVDLDPSQNPYLHWVLKGYHNAFLPMAWRAENFEIIKSRLDRLDIRQGALEEFVESGEKADGYNLSDIFEYLSEAACEALYGGILSASNPNARLIYWNMMVPRRCPAKYQSRIHRLAEVEAVGKANDKAFFYSDFVVEEVLP